MPKSVQMTDADRQWLRQHHNDYTYKFMAGQIGCCVDTLKRILVREGLQEFDGAKYELPRDHKVAQWERPCMSCGSTEKRPKFWFFCRSCRSSLGYEDE